MNLKRKKLINILLIAIFLLVGVLGFFGSVKAQACPPGQTFYMEGCVPTSDLTGITERTQAANSELSPSEPVGANTTGKGASSKKPSSTVKNPDDTENSIANVVAWILFYIATFFSYFVAILVRAMVYIASYNEFLSNQIVINGWSIVRDVANNFFIVILLVIAVGTILRVPNYNRQLLPKLLVMAVLINFSKTFAGIMIDASQVLTLWFADAIGKASSGGNIILLALGLDELYRVSVNPSFNDNQSWTSNILDLTPGEAIKTLLMALILSVVACVVIAMITIVLVYRIVMLWFLVILSPLAFLLTTFPKGQQYAGMWWSEIAKYLVVAPVMLFFLYLSFFAGSAGTAGGGYQNPSGRSDTAEYVADKTKDNIPALQSNDTLGLNKFANNPVTLFNFLIIIGLMVGSLVAGQKTGVAGGQWAGKGVSTLQKWGKKATVDLGQKVAIGTAQKAGRGALATTSGGIGLLDKGLGKFSSRLGVGDSARKVGAFAGAYRKDLLETRGEAREAKRRKLFKKLGMGDKAVEAWGGVADSRLGKGAKMVTTATIGTGAALTAGALTGGAAWIPALLASAASFSPFFKNSVAKSEKDRNGEVSTSAKQRDAEKERLKTSKDKAVGDQEKYHDDKMSSIRDGQITDRTNGAGLDQMLIDKIHSWNTRDGKNHFTDDAKIEEARKETLAEAGPELAKLRDESIKGLNEGFERDKESADKDHEVRVQAIGQPTWMQKQWGDYHPNKVTMDVVKKVTKEKADIEKLIASLAGGADISEFRKSTFHAESGQTARHERFFKSLSDGSEKSVNALKQMSSTLQTIQNGILTGNAITKEQVGNLIGLKQGLAAYKKGGGNMSHFSQIIADLNKIKTHNISESNDKLAKTVEDHETTVISK